MRRRSSTRRTVASLRSTEALRRSRARGASPGTEPRTTRVGAKEQNGDVEASNGALKRRLAQQLILRGSKDFESWEAYEKWIQEICGKANQGRQLKLEEELAAMRAMTVGPLPEFTETTMRVRSWSTIRVKQNSYSKPSQLIGERVRVRIYEDRIEVWHGGEPPSAPGTRDARPRPTTD